MLLIVRSAMTLLPLMQAEAMLISDLHSPAAPRAQVVDQQLPWTAGASHAAPDQTTAGRHKIKKQLLRVQPSMQLTTKHQTLNPALQMTGPTEDVLFLSSV
jgi:hypothetical protein